jgi:hypothetical protein
MMIASGSRGLVVRRLADFPYAIWVNKVVVRGIVGIFPAAVYASLFAMVMPPSLGRMVALSITTGLVAIVGAFYLGMSSAERQSIMELAKPVLLKLV